MKYLYICIIIIEFVFLVSSGVNDYKFYPLLPAGKYKLFFRSIMQCNIIGDQIQQNFYLNKLSRNTSQLRGNLTILTPFDDSYTIHIHMAIKDTIGGWKDNAFIHQAPKGCSRLKNILGTEWPVLMNSHGIYNTSCPLSPGAFISKGYDLSRIASKANFPKTFFYGTYKFRLFFTDQHNKEHGCCIFIIDIKRPWEFE